MSDDNGKLLLRLHRIINSFLNKIICQSALVKRSIEFLVDKFCESSFLKRKSRSKSVIISEMLIVLVCAVPACIFSIFITITFWTSIFAACAIYKENDCLIFMERIKKSMSPLIIAGICLFLDIIFQN